MVQITSEEKSSMTIGTDHLGSLSAFMGAADAGSFTEAGRRLGLSPSAVSKAVMRLEDSLGARLFHRSTRSLTLTPEGRMFLERCRRIAAELEAADQDLSQTREGPRGKLKFSMPSAGMPLLPKLAEFQKMYPEIELDVGCTDRLVDVIEEGFDVVLRAGETSDSRLMMRFVGTYRQVVVGSVDYLRRRGVPRIPEDLKQHNCIVYRSHANGKILRWPLRATGEEIDISRFATTVTDLLEPQLVFAREGVGLVCVPDIAVQKDLRNGTLVSVLDDYADGPVRFRVLWPSSRHLTPKVRVFIDFVAENLLS